MEGMKVLMKTLYAAFNERDIDGCLGLMVEQVDWPTASEGGRVVGKEQVRAYWTRQWAEFDPHVEPVEVIEREGGRVDVRVHQVVRDLQGGVLMDGEVWHVYAIANGLVERMDVFEKEPGVGESSTEGVSAGWHVR